MSGRYADPMTEAPLPRRTVVQAGAAIAAGLTLAACSNRNDANPPQGKKSATVKKSDVPVGGGYIVPDANFVVTQPTAGQYVAFVKVCPHAGCAVSKVENNQILCPCHGSLFSATDGKVQKGPASSGLGKAKLVDEGDNLTVSGS